MGATRRARLTPRLTSARRGPGAKRERAYPSYCPYFATNSRHQGVELAFSRVLKVVIAPSALALISPNAGLSDRAYANFAVHREGDGEASVATSVATTSYVAANGSASASYRFNRS